MMKIKLLIIKSCFIMITGCSKSENGMLYSPDRGRTAYVYSTQTPTSPEQSPFSFFSDELPGKQPLHPEKPSRYISSVKSKVGENYVIRFEQNNSEKLSNSKRHDIAFSAMQNCALKVSYIKSFTLHTISSSGEIEVSSWIKK